MAGDIMVEIIMYHIPKSHIGDIMVGEIMVEIIMHHIPKSHVVATLW
jgi:hypothetical protein